jgi:hypothetical protein
MFFSKKPKKSKTTKPTREEMMAELRKNSAQAREAIGEENLQKLAAQITGKKPEVKIEPSPMHRAKELLKSMDNERLADNIRAVAREDD